MSNFWWRYGIIISVCTDLLVDGSDFYPFTKRFVTTILREPDQTMQTAVLSREEKGRKIAEKHDQVMRVDDGSYKVASQSRDVSYDVVRTERGWICTCFDHFYRQVRCKHIIAVDLSKKLREHVQARVIEPITDIHGCLFCKSENIKKDGLRHNKYGDIQKFYCKNCGKWFTVNFGFERMKHNPQGITTAMQLYFSGESLRNVARSLRLLGVHVCHRTVYNWIAKYTALMEKYLDQITPQVSDTWATDELFLKVKGNLKYLYVMMDEQTRFWIAQEVAETKYTADVRPLFQQAKAIAGKTPKTLVALRISRVSKIEGYESNHDHSVYLYHWSVRPFYFFTILHV